ncbi:MAG: type II toxin-antitoxin system VapC family toxin [Bacillota bacterium]
MNGKSVVVDASLAAKWVVNEEGTETAVNLLERWAEEGFLVAAPCLIFIEVTNALYKRVRRGELTLSDAVILLEHLASLGIAIQDTASLHARTLELADRFGLPSTYDAYYLSLAETLQCEFWTADQRLYNIVKQELNWVHIV